ncbi:MAG TPA: hypothetical protein VGK67_14570, partial [Myxococcales bacterium]
MPYEIKVVAAGAWTSAEPELAYRERLLSDLRAGDYALDDLKRDLAAVLTDAPALQVAVIAKGEEGEHNFLVVRERRVEHYVLERKGRGWTVPGRADLDELLAKLARREPAPAKPTAPSSREAAVARAQQTMASKSVDAMFASLDDPELAGSAGASTRTELWRALIRNRKLPATAADRVFHALRDEPAPIADLIGGMLFLFDGFAPRLFAELAAAAKGLPSTRVQAERLCRAVSEFKRESCPPKFREELPASLRQRLDRKAAGPVENGLPTKEAVRAIESLVANLQKGSIAGHRAAWRAARSAESRSEVRDQVRSALAPLAAAGAVETRAAALDVLAHLGVPPPELAPLARDLPETAGVRELQGGAGLKVAAASPWTPPPATRDWGEVRGAARVAGGALVISRKNVASFVANGKTRWRFELEGSPLEINSALGGSGGVVFLGSPFGLHCLELATGRERWSSPTVTFAEGTCRGSVVDPRPQIWLREQTLWLVGHAQAFELSSGDGRLLRAVDLPCSETRGVLPHPGGMLICDGAPLLESFSNSDFAPSGLLLREDGNVEVLEAPRIRYGVRRELDGVAVDVSAVDVVIESAEGRRRLALPLAPGESLEAVGALERGSDGCRRLALGVHVPP